MPADSATQIVADTVAVAPGESIAYQISYSTDEAIRGLQFSIYDNPDWVTVDSVSTQLADFDVFFADSAGYCQVLIVSLQGLVIPHSTDSPLVTMHLSVDAAAVVGQAVDMDFSPVIASDSLGNALWVDAASGIIHISDVVQAPEYHQADVEQMAVSPNPTTGPSTISFESKRDGEKQLLLFDVSGRLRQVIVPNRWLVAGPHRMAVYLSVPPGVYFVVLSGEQMIYHKVTVVRK